MLIDDLCATKWMSDGLTASTSASTFNWRLLMATFHSLWFVCSTEQLVKWIYVDRRLVCDELTASTFGKPLKGELSIIWQLALNRRNLGSNEHNFKILDAACSGRHRLLRRRLVVFSRRPNNKPNRLISPIWLYFLLPIRYYGDFCCLILRRPQSSCHVTLATPNIVARDPHIPCSIVHRQ